MTGRIETTSPRRLARTAGLFFLLTMVTGIYAQGFISERLVVSGDAAATAANILAHRPLFRLAYAVYLIEMTCDIVMTVLFYFLLRPAGRTVALLSACFGLVGITIKTLGRVFFIAPLFLLGSMHPLGGFDTGQLASLAALLFRLDDQAAGMGLVFFGFSSLLEGWLILRSTFLPRILGVISVLGGLGWLTYLDPPFASRAFPVVAAIGLLGSVLMIGWLLVFGVNEQRWREQAAGAT